MAYNHELRERESFPDDDPMYRGLLGEAAMRAMGLDKDKDGSMYGIPGPDDRYILARQTGNVKDPAVVIMGGTPTSLGAREHASYTAYHLGARILEYYRPGYSFSSPNPGRKPVDSIKDVRSILKFFDVEGPVHFVGRSGGGAHALACATLMPEAGRTAILASHAPIQYMTRLGWFEGMSPSNREAYKALYANPKLLKRQLAKNTEDIQRDPHIFLDRLRAEFAPDDDLVFNDRGVEAGVLESYERNQWFGMQGWYDDAYAQGDWGFDPRDFDSRGDPEARSVLVWHGGEDRFVPYGQGLWLAQNIPGAKHVYAPEAGHFRAMGRKVPLKSILYCLTGRYRTGQDEHQYKSRALD